MTNTKRHALGFGGDIEDLLHLKRLLLEEEDALALEGLRLVEDLEKRKALKSRPEEIPQRKAPASQLCVWRVRGVRALKHMPVT